MIKRGRASQREGIEETEVPARGVIQICWAEVEMIRESHLEAVRGLTSMESPFRWRRVSLQWTSSILGEITNRRMGQTH
jgi:hypothetical protein